MTYTNVLYIYIMVCIYIDTKARLCITNLIQVFITFSSIPIPSPYSFVTTTLKSNLELTEIVTEVSRLLPQLTDFIGQFHSIVSANNVNVITDVAGNMSIDVPSNMSDDMASKISTRLGIVDRLITNHGTTINDLFQKGLHIEQQLKVNNPSYVSQLNDHISTFKQLNASYKH